MFPLGMRKEWILTDEEKRLKRKKIERNRLLKQQAQLAIQQTTQGNATLPHSKYPNNLSMASTNEVSPFTICSTENVIQRIEIEFTGTVGVPSRLSYH